MGRRRKRKQALHELPDPYQVKFTKKSRKERVVLVPNTFPRLQPDYVCGHGRQGIRTEPLPLAGRRPSVWASSTWHNDICFPAQIVIGEALAALRSGRYDDKHTAIAMGKIHRRLPADPLRALLRKALDDAGYSHVPILTNDDRTTITCTPDFT